MIKSIPISQWLSIPAVQKLKGLALSAVRMLTLSLADDPIAPATCISISLEKGGLSIVYAKRFLSGYKILHLKTYNFKQGDYPDANEVASALKMFMDEKGLRTAPVTLCIPKGWTITRASEFPASVGDDLSASIQYEMDRLTPFSSDEVFFDYRSYGISEGKIQFILSVTKTDTVKDYLDTLKSNGYIVNRLTSNPSALCTLQNFSDRNRDRTKLLLEIADNYIETSVIVNGMVRKVFGSDIQTETKTSTVDKIISSNTDRLKKDGVSPLVLVYFRDPDPRLKEALRVKLPSTRFIDEMSFGIKGIADKKDIHIHALGGALEALWPDANALNLLSQGIRVVPKKSYVLSAVIAALFMVLLAVFSVAPLWQEKELAGSMDKKINEIKKEAMSVEKIKQEIGTMEDKISLIRDFHINETRRIILIKELTKIIPEDTWINRTRIAEDNVELYGYSEAATKLIPKIEASKYFVNVEFASPTMRDARMDMDRFAIKAKIEEK